jgi:hypothetical protein
MATINSINTPSLTNGQTWLGNTGHNPTSGLISSTAGTLTVTTGAGTLNMDVTAPLPVAYGGTGNTTFATDAIIITQGSGAFTTVGPLTNGQTLIGVTGGVPIASTLTAGTGIAITNGSGTITIAATGTNPTYTVETSSFSLVANNGYITNGGSLVVATLPAAATVGQTFIVTNISASGWQIAQNAGQVIQIGDESTTSGVTGYLQSNNIGDTVTFICTVVNTNFQVISMMGNVTYN